MGRCVFTPLVKDCDQYGRLVAHSELVIPRGHGPVTLEAINPALDGMPLAVVGLVELRRPTTLRAESLAVADPVGRNRDGRLDAASSQVGPVTAGVVRLVCPHPFRSAARPARADPRHPDRVQDRHELRRVSSLPGCDHDGQRLLPLLNGKMDLGGQPTPGAPEAVVGGLGEDAAGRLLLKIPLFDAPAACWWARQTVESTFTSQVIRPLVSASAWNWVTILAQVPSRCQRRNRS